MQGKREEDVVCRVRERKGREEDVCVCRVRERKGREEGMGRVREQRVCKGRECRK